MKSRLKQNLWIVLLAFFGLSYSSALSAQTEGKTGTTITLDGNSSHALYSNGAGSADKTIQYFGYLRHDIAHVQLVASNYPDLASSGMGLFKQNANNMLFDTETKCLKLYNWNTNKVFAYYAVVAPKGYRFTRYQWDINPGKSTEGTSVAQYTYNAEGSIVLSGDSVVVSSDMKKWDVTLSNGSNVLYFRYNAASTAATALFLNSLKLTYVIDQPFESQLPNSNGGTDIHTGVIDMGEFTNVTISGKSINVFDRDYIGDAQSANFYQDATKITPQVVTIGDAQYFAVGKDGDYYVEAPEKFRVIGASFKFLRSDIYGESTTTTTIVYKEAASITSGEEYLICSNGSYLNINGSSLTYGKDQSTATRWKFTSSSEGYYISSGDYNLYVGFGGTFSASKDNKSLWTINNKKLQTSYTFIGTTYYYLCFKEEGWKVSESSSEASELTFYQYTTETVTIPSAISYKGGDFTANVYTRDNKSGADSKLDEGTTEAELTVENYNNDAIHFKISGLADNTYALYNVSLKLLPLNPELQNLSVASKVDDEEIENTTSFTAENYNFNDGNSVTVIVPSNTEAKTCNVIFQNAFNEEGTLWYTSGDNENNPASTGGYSNYFLVNSAADNPAEDKVGLNVDAPPHPTARISAEQAGTTKLKFTNIEEVYNGTASNLKDNAYKKQDAGYAVATLAVDGAEATYYIYSADQPTFNILPDAVNSRHIDFRYFTLKMICKKQKEEPVVTLTPIYTSTLKSQNHKNTSVDSDGDKMSEAVTFIGVKVTAKLADKEEGTALGYLTSEQVVNAIKDAISAKSQSIMFPKNDVLRGVLYIDMSELKGVDNAQFTKAFDESTADNCLYFMYQGFHRENVTNTIAKTSDGFEAIGNIKVYDQQPFFSPHDFKTGSFTVSYTREGTVQGKNTKATVKNMAVVLPFDVNLDGNGKLKSASDVVNNTVTYHNITGSGDLTSVRPGDAGELTYAVVAEPITDAVVAKANEPYYVTTTENGFTYNIAGAQFRATPNEQLTRTSGTWTAVGTYCGVQPTIDNQLWYFAKDYFWKSGNLKSTNVVDVRPFRAYFTTTDKATESKATVVFSSDDVVPTGISSVAEGKNSLLLSVGVGTITATASSADILGVYTLAGQLVAKSNLNAGQTLTVSVPKGVYIVNNVKVVVK